MLRYDQRDFAAAVRDDTSVTRDSLFCFNIQAVEAIKGAIKTIRR